MEREQSRAESRAQKNRQRLTMQGRTVDPTPPAPTGAAAPRRPFALWTVGLLVAFGLPFGLWGMNATTGTSAKEKAASLSAPIAVARSPFAPNLAGYPLAGAAPTTSDAPFMGNAGVVKAGDLKKGDTVWHNGRWLTVANMERKTVEATPDPAPSLQPVLEADLNLDLSETNGGRTFDVGRIVPCSQPVFLVSGGKATVGNLKVGDRIRMTGGNVGRVVSIGKKWHTPTPPKYDENGDGLNRVIATTKRMTDRLLYLYTSVELVKTTPEHPFAVKGKGYVKAGRLEPGDVLETQDGKVVTVARTEVRNEPQLVYNLEVENAHNFFVGKNAMLVHNGGDCVPGFPGEYLADKAPKQVASGVRQLEGQYINDLGHVEPWTAHYDEFGRMIGRTDYTAGNATAGIPPVHHHVYEYGPGFNAGREVGKHLPGPFVPPIQQFPAR